MNAKRATILGGLAVAAMALGSWGVSEAQAGGRCGSRGGYFSFGYSSYSPSYYCAPPVYYTAPCTTYGYGGYGGYYGYRPYVNNCGPRYGYSYSYSRPYSYSHYRPSYHHYRGGRYSYSRCR